MKSILIFFSFVRLREAELFDIDWASRLDFWHLVTLFNFRRKFRSQTSDNMDRWKAEMGRVREEKTRKKTKKRKSQSQKKERKESLIEVREKVGKSRTTVFFQWFVAPEGRKVGSLKRRVRSHVVRWEMKSCKPLWREAHFQVKSVKTDGFRALLEVERSKKCMPVAKHISKSKCTKHFSFGALLEVATSKKCTPLSRFCFAWQAQGIMHLVKSEQNVRVLAVSKTMAGVGHLKRIWKDASRAAGAIQETCSSEMLGGQDADFLRVVAFWSIRSSVLGRWFGVTGAALCMGRRSILDRWSRKIAKRIGTRPSALHSTFHFWRKSCRIVSFLTFVTFENRGSLAELSRFWCCQIQKLRKSRRIVSFLTLSSSKMENVSQNSFVFKLADR